MRTSLLAVGVGLALIGSGVASAADRYIVEVQDGYSVAAIARTLSQEKSLGRVHHQFEELGAMAVTLSPGQLKALRTDPRVKRIEVDPPRFPMAQSTPYGITQVGAPTAWGSGHTGAGVMVCIIDSGLNMAHEEFAAVDVVGGYPTGWNTDTCGHGTHVAGTIAAADNTTGVVGVSPGDVSLYAVQVFSGGSCGWSYASTLIDAANRCKSAADAAGKRLVINMSLGGAGSSTTEQNGFQSLYDAGVLSIAAAGNDGVATSTTDALSYPASYSSVVSVAAVDSAKALADFSQKNAQVELAAPGVDVQSTYIRAGSVTVGSTVYDAAGMTGSPQSSRSGALVDGGTCETVGAWSGKVVLCQRGNIAFENKVLNAQNGGGVAAIVYNNVSGSFGGTLSDPTATTIPSVSMSMEDGQLLKSGSLGATATVSTIPGNAPATYASLSGTSMASPHVAGAAAVVWSSNLSASNVQVRNALTSTAEDLGTAGRDVKFGYGHIRIPNAIAALAGPAPDTTAPTIPGSLVATATSSSQINLSWTASTDTGGSNLAGYKIERCQGVGCSSFTQIATTTSTSYSNTGLTAATSYSYRVRAYDGAANNSSYSSNSTATTQSSGGGGGSVLANGTPVTGLSGATGAQLAYTMVVPAGATNLKFTLAGGTGDADLYVKFGSAPTTSSYTCRSWASGNTETCSIATAQAGTYYVMINGYAAFSGVTLTGSYTAGTGGGETAQTYSNTADVTISDNSTVESAITVSGRTGSGLSTTQVAVDIRHTYQGDLKVDLIAPDGSVYVLHNRTGSGTDNIIKTYSVNLSSEAKNGTWKLRVNDNASGDTGYINSWSVTF